VIVISGNEPFAQFGHLRALQDCFDAGSDTGQDVCPRKPVTQLCIQIAGLKSKGKMSVTVNGMVLFARLKKTDFLPYLRWWACTSGSRPFG